MSSVRLGDLRRTTSFRLAGLFAGSFGVASLFLFGFLYWQTIGYLSTLVQQRFEREIRLHAAVAASEVKRALDARKATEPDDRFPIALLAADGTWLAGSEATLPPPLPAMDQPFEMTLPRGGQPAKFLGLTHRLPSGEILLVARDMRDIDQFNELLLGAMGAGGVVVMLLALTGAALIGAGALGRIDAVTGAIERIIDGDLSQRLPSGGGGDLDRLIQVVNRMLDDIERLMHEVKGATEDIAHDLRTPLTRLLAGLERGRRRGMSIADYGSAIDEAIAETKDVLGTFTALLRIAEVESGARRVGFTTLDLDTVAADVAELYEPVAEAKGIMLSLQTAGQNAVAANRRANRGRRRGGDRGRFELAIRGNKQPGR